MSKQLIKISPEEYKNLYEGWMHKSMTTEGEVMGTYSNQELDLLYKFVGFTYQILTAIGIIAGFGFTAIGKVKAILMFGFGEAFMVAAILWGLYWIQKFYESNIHSIQETSNALFSIYQPRDKAFLRMSDEYIKTQHINKADIDEVMAKEKEILDYMGSSERRKTKKEFLPHTSTLFLAAIGFILILLSFIMTLSFFTKFPFLNIQFTL